MLLEAHPASNCQGKGGRTPAKPSACGPSIRSGERAGRLILGPAQEKKKEALLGGGGGCGFTIRKLGTGACPNDQRFPNRRGT